LSFKQSTLYFDGVSVFEEVVGLPPWFVFIGSAKGFRERNTTPRRYLSMADTLGARYSSGFRPKPNRQRFQSDTPP
jgi:hypothetical protein